MSQDLSSKIGEVLFEPPSRSVSRQVYSIVRPDSTGYVALRHQVNSIVLHQAMLDKVVQGRSSAVYDWYYSAKGLFYRLVFRERQLSVEELFDAQLDNVASLNYNLCHITSNAKGELDSFKEYYSDRHAELKRFVGVIETGDSDIGEKVKKYNGLEREFSSLRKKDAHFFDLEMGLRKMKREISSGAHNYDIANESVLDLAEEMKFLGVVEDLLTSSIHLSEHIAVKAKRLERHISATKQVYVLVKSQQEAVQSLEAAVGTLTNFTLGLHKILAGGLQEMAGMMKPGSGLNSFYSSANNNFGRLVASVSEANLMRSREVEDTVQRYLSSA